MGGILSILANLFVSTVPTVLFVFLLFVIFNQFLFKPLTAVMKKQEETTGAMGRARSRPLGRGKSAPARYYFPGGPGRKSTASGRRPGVPCSRIGKPQSTGRESSQRL